MKKYRFEIIIFIVNAVYMILELIASRILSPYFGSSNVVWTSVIGIILLSSSIGNYIGGIIADKDNSRKNVKLILGVTGVLILILLGIQGIFLSWISDIIGSIKIGAVISTIILFFLPSMVMGFLSPIIIKLKLEKVEEAGKVSGKIYAIGTLGGIVGTFLGGFYLLPTLGSKTTLFILAVVMFILIYFVDLENNKKIDIVIITCIILIAIVISVIFKYVNNIKSEQVNQGKIDIAVEYDTEYGKVEIENYNIKSDLVRVFKVDKGNESAMYINEDKYYELFAEYTKYYDLMFESSREIQNSLMIGGAGYSYPKYYISKYPNKNMDVVEIDGKVTELAKEYFYLDNLIEEFNLENNNRLNIIEQDGRIYLNKNTKKYDAILNDAFSGSSPAETLTTVEAVNNIYNSLNDGGIYLTNIISAVDGKDSKFIKAEMNTLKQVFKNVYAIPINADDRETVQNIMVVATDEQIKFDGAVDIELKPNEIILTDDCCPVDNLIPII